LWEWQPWPLEVLIAPPEVRPEDVAITITIYPPELIVLPIPD
jgi:hypothetical protein